MDRIFTALATRIASAAGQPLSFVLAFGLILRWGISGPLFGYSDTWQLVINTGTTIVTFLMVFLIQNSQNRDAAAMQAKLDEVIRALDSAREQFIGIEHRSAVEVENIRAALEKEVGCDQGKAGTADDSVEHVLRRT